MDCPTCRVVAFPSARFCSQCGTRPADESLHNDAVVCSKDIAAQKLGEESLRAINARLRTDSAALTRRNSASERLWRILELPEGLDAMLTATVELLGADKGNVQLLDADRGVFYIAAQCGFEKEFLDFFREVLTQDESACGQALRSRTRIVIEDVEIDPAYAPYRAITRAAAN